MKTELTEEQIHKSLALLVSNLLEKCMAVFIEAEGIWLTGVDGKYLSAPGSAGGLSSGWKRGARMWPSGDKPGGDVAGMILLGGHQGSVGMAFNNDSGTAINEVRPGVWKVRLVGLMTDRHLATCQATADGIEPVAE